MYLNFSTYNNSAITIQLTKGYNANRISEDARVHFVNKSIYELGIQRVETMFGNTVKVYDHERTICDLIKNRPDIDSEIFSQALRYYIKSQSKDIPRLFDYARKMKFERQTQELVKVHYE
ncbi:MAG TPA: hypothetical protein DD636_02525 [Anaerolineaceae bacterium]|jgi:hypothetical protein|nr:hypothetical protein [Anaerolineaceae bacterium]